MENILEYKINQKNWICKILYFFSVEYQIDIKKCVKSFSLCEMLMRIPLYS